jgi:hypothetical protein
MRSLVFRRRAHTLAALAGILLPHGALSAAPPDTPAIPGSAAKADADRPNGTVPGMPARIVIAKDDPGLATSIATDANGFVTHQTRKLTLWWTPADRAATYVIYRGLAPGKEAPVPIARNVTACHYTDAGLKDGTTYFYRVAGRNAAGEGPRSPEASAATKSAPRVISVQAEPQFLENRIKTSAWLHATAESQDSKLSYRWKILGAPPGAVDLGQSTPRSESPGDDRSLVRFKHPGVYRFQVTVTDSEGLAGSAPLTVTVASQPTSVTITPPSSVLLLGGAKRFTATVKDQFGAVVVPQPAVRWSMPPGDAAIDPSTGIATVSRIRPGPPQYDTIVTASIASGQASGKAAVTIRDVAPALVKPASITLCPEAEMPTPKPVLSTPEAARAWERLRAATVRLSVLASHPGGDMTIHYAWSLAKAPEGANQNLTPFSPVVTYWFTKDGEYTFRVTITDDNGQSVVSTVNATVRDGALVSRDATGASVRGRRS